MSKTTTATNHQDNPSHTPSHKLSDEQAELCVMSLLLSRGSRYPWSKEELIRMIGHRIPVLDAISNLEGAGLLHRIDQFIWPTLAARRADEIEEAGI